MGRRILIVDDEVSIQRTLAGALTDEGYEVSTVSGGEDCLAALKAGSRPDVILLDIWMKGIDGLETLKQVRAEYPDQLVIMMSGHATIDTAVKATKHGALDFLEKPPSLERLLVLLRNATSVQDLARENQALRHQVGKQRALVGTSAAIKQLQGLIKRVAPTTGSVLITGEAGVGKELVAQSIHLLSPRFNKPFIEVNCAAIPEELIESELFGHEKGAFTGAAQMKRGKFDLANGGTLFLDEIADMSLKTQAKVLRILQEQKFERVGGTQTLSVDVRIVAATNKDLKQEIARGSFRADLFYRLNVVPFVVPPLRERLEDVSALARHFLKEYSVMHGRKERALSPEAEALLKAYSWPGNVRELKNLMERIMILTLDECEGTPVKVDDLLSHLEADSLSRSALASDPDTTQSGIFLTGGASTLKDARAEFEREFIVKALKENDNNVSKTAQALGIERSYLHRKIKAFGIEVGE